MIEFFLILLCLLLNGLLAASEVALISLNKFALREEARHGDLKIKLLLELRENPERSLSIIQIGVTFVGSLAAAITGASADDYLSPIISDFLGINQNLAGILSVLIVILPLTYLNVVIGELVPKTLALRQPLAISLKTAPYLVLFSKFISPVVTLFEHSTRHILSFLPHRHTKEETFGEIDSSKDAINIKHLSPPNREYIFNLFRIERATIGEIFIPSADTVCVDTKFSIQDIQSTIISSGHTRLPVIDTGVVIGTLNAKELLAFHKKGKSNWIELVRPAVFFEEKQPILSVLRALQNQHLHMGIVGTAATFKGIITMEAIFEEIIGDIYDEDDDGALDRILSLKPHQT